MLQHNDYFYRELIPNINNSFVGSQLHKILGESSGRESECEVITRESSLSSLLASANPVQPFLSCTAQTPEGILRGGGSSIYKRIIVQGVSAQK